MKPPTIDIEIQIPQEVSDEPGVVRGGGGLDHRNAGLFGVAEEAVAEEEVEEGGEGGGGVAKGGFYGGEVAEESESRAGGRVEGEEA